MRKLLSLSLLLCLVSVLPAGAAEKIALTYVKAPLNVPSIVEKKLELFEKAFAPDGIDVVYPEITAGPAQTQAMAAGSIQFANCLGGTSALLAASAGVDLKIIAVYSRAPEAFVLLAKDPSVTSVADLKGKKVAGPKGTVLHQLLATALKEASMGADDVQFLSMGLPEGVAALLSGSVDAALAAGPAAYKAQEAGARVVVDGRGLVDATTVIAVAGPFLREHPDRVRRFLDVHRQALTFMKEEREQAFSLTAEETGLDVSAVEAMFPLYDFDPEIRPSDVEELKRTQDFLVENGLMEKTVDVDALVTRL
ncbi:NrtA/SsuA/CpmA family ABC transporter substrate-binding protein [Aminithiophilus ramosus]|uniref:NrtA/SsuA/CpmA family ABC transporter substrate-binding protein n=2 Tax=Synergistales TaxID=649776 RepID=A0A9Q7ACK6_9BACT|nr:NrtA/SsuA/CpmA family ABC transporter substrate-binding protein [Aminithiophilus ramosus]QTX32418.1 NrtA/SsuA/CpmA family ABC transporter substrate-binding protein [Aminithiophilus ramosus]QVL36295.1 NrtA/SsuA/CpmA family ABC transporter substrate-binding protein [Synergistota bacterium]